MFLRFFTELVTRENCAFGYIYINIYQREGGVWHSPPHTLSFASPAADYRSVSFSRQTLVFNAAPLSPNLLAIRWVNADAPELLNTHVPGRTLTSPLPLLIPPRLFDCLASPCSCHMLPNCSSLSSFVHALGTQFPKNLVMHPINPT